MSTMQPPGLYISVPFCRSKCTYCNFASGVFPASYMERYIERVGEDLRSILAESSWQHLPRVLDSIYLGGGTPSLLPSELMRKLFAAIRDEFAIADTAEITVECAPGQLADDTLFAMTECGVNRISFGVQSFIDREAKETGRLHSRGMALEDLRRVHGAGMGEVSVDLIAGLPHQSEASWRESLDVLCSTGVNHASVYMLEVDDDSRLGREVLNGGARYFAPAIPSDDAIAEMYLTAIDVLSRNGLRQYEISNFAAGQAESVHNKKYWQRKPYLGLGVDAHSMLRDESGRAVRFATTADLQSYLDAPGWSERSRLAREEELEEAWFLGLRLNDGISLRELENEFGAEAVGAYSRVVDALIADGNLVRRDGRVSLTPRGRLLSNEVFAEFLDVESIVSR